MLRSGRSGLILSTIRNTLNSWIIAGANQALTFAQLHQARPCQSPQLNHNRIGEITMFHEITIIGHLGRQPEMRYTPSGQAVTNFSLAANRCYTNGNGEQVKETIWFRVATWGRLAETCNQYLSKGRLVFVTGRLNPDPATGRPRIFNRQDGSAGASFEITASQVLFLSGRGEDNGVAGQPIEDDGGEIPF
jgi:single-strand DNA-binding protein